jgi:biotin synthase
VESQHSEYKAQGENPKWTRPEHKIERNEESKVKAKEIRAQLKD